MLILLVIGLYALHNVGLGYGEILSMLSWVWVLAMLKASTIDSRILVSIFSPLYALGVVMLAFYLREGAGFYFLDEENSRLAVIGIALVAAIRYFALVATAHDRSE